MFTLVINWSSHLLLGVVGFGIFRSGDHKNCPSLLQVTAGRHVLGYRRSILESFSTQLADHWVLFIDHHRTVQFHVLRAV